ncbi:hypothetical protein ZYGM_000515 [Zygosaccharomyces mellis]|uniref:Glucosidase II subunit alpha n=1 Tax=Zygosaccharomyces mellis TaxID=42258 RepID=A0A4C2E9T2_9SACH|nr:hypothetical protein ZYGM_000515 [Zygosaccharomyces mellis]
MQFSRFLQLFFFWSHLHAVSAFDQYLLRKCNTAGFCKRNRQYAENIQRNNTHPSYYVIDESSIRYDGNENSFHANVIKNIPSGIKLELPFKLQFLQDGNVVRFSIDEIRSYKDYLPKVLNQRRYNETSKWAFADSPSAVPITERKKVENKIVIGSNSSDSRIELFLDSFLINVYWKNQLSMVVNERSLLNYEHLRSKDENFKNLLPEESDFDMFHDSFNYSRSDTMPFGPESVSLDFTFNEFENLYGLPEHPASFRIEETIGGEPYRLFAADVPRYDVGTRMPTYGNIPFVIGNNEKSAAGLFWVNAADTWIDFKYPGGKAQSHWMSETGIIDVVMFLADTPMEITDKYTNLTGRPTLPKEAAIGHHQSRWNYYNESDVMNVDSNMEKGEFPYDIIWLDLDYTDEKKFFTWKPDAFPNPARLLKRLGDLGRGLVVLIDPHLKKDYYYSNTVVKNDVAIKNRTGQTFFGTCWPGVSVWIDTFSELGGKVWGNFYRNFVNGTKNLGIWNDMDEPSVFDGIETTAPKNSIHAGGFEHRAVHNVYSLTVHQATYNGLANIFNGTTRPFVLTRSHFAGSQRTAGTWTGDNVASWNYLQISIPMVLSSNVAGMSFTGADIAGFLDNPEDELIIRWYQAGLWYPFFRAHAQNETRRREPFLFKDPMRSYVRNAIQLRYHLLPTFYTAFFKSNLNGSPIMKPMIFEKPKHTNFAAVDDQFYVGDSGILVKPIVKKNTSFTQIQVADGVYYDFHNLKPQKIASKNGTSDIKYIGIAAGLDKIPILLEGGHIITKRESYRKSSVFYRNDPYTLVVAPDAFGNACGDLYADDGETWAHKSGQYLYSVFSFQDFRCLMGNTANVPSNHEAAGNTLIDKIVIAIGNNNASIGDTVKINSGDQQYTVNVDKSSPYEAIITHPMVYANETWQIYF